MTTTVPFGPGFDPTTEIAGLEWAPNLAIDVQPDAAVGTFVLDEDELDGDALLGWEAGWFDVWLNIVCDVTAVRVRRGATRLQGPLTRAEAGLGTVELIDSRRVFDPLVNADAIHSGTPIRVRAWDSYNVLTPLTQRTNLTPNPSATVDLAEWNTAWGSVSAHTIARVADATSGSPYAFELTGTATAAAGAVEMFAEIPVTGGQPVSIGAVGRLSAGAAPGRAARMRVEWLDEFGGVLSAGPATSTTSATFAPLTLAGLTAPAAAWFVRVWLSATVTGTGTFAARFSRVLVEQATTLGPYFDGDTVGDDDVFEGAITYGWENTANASASYQAVTEWVLTPWTAVLFTAKIDEIPVRYVKSGPPEVTLTMVDVIGELASWSAPGRDDPGVGQGDDLRDRVDRVLAEMSRPVGDVSNLDSDPTFVATLAPSALAGGWDDITAAADAELGAVWVNSANKLVVRARESELSGPMRGTLSDWHGEATYEPHSCYTDLDAVLGTESFANRAIAARRVPTPAVGTAVESAIVARDDVYSQSRYRRVHTLDRRDLELDTDAQLTPWVDSVLATTSAPELRIDTVQPAPWNAGVEAWRAVCLTDIGDRWALRYHPEEGPTVMRTVGVLGISHDITPGAWSTTWTTTDAPTPGTTETGGWFTLDVSELDGGDLLTAFAGYVHPL